MKLHTQIHNLLFIVFSRVMIIFKAIRQCIIHVWLNFQHNMSYFMYSDCTCISTCI